MQANSRAHNLDHLSADHWINQRRAAAYDLRSSQLVPQRAAQAPAPASPARAGTFRYPGTGTDTDQEMAALRRQQADFHEGEKQVDKQNRWMLAPVFAPELTIAALEAGGLLGLRFLGSQLKSAPAVARSAPVETIVARASSGTPATRRVLSQTGGAVRARGRAVFARKNGQAARDLSDDGEVHHRIGVEYSQQMPRADSNRFPNLVGLEEDTHQIITNEWAAFRRALGREPTQAEVMAQALRMDKRLEPYVLRPGLPRPPPKP